MEQIMLILHSTAWTMYSQPMRLNDPCLRQVYNIRRILEGN